MVQSRIEAFTAMLAEQPENAMIWYGLASEQYKLENWAEAAKSLRQVVSLSPVLQFVLFTGQAVPDHGVFRLLGEHCGEGFDS